MARQQDPMKSASPATKQGDAGEIKSKIEDTRAEMDETIDALGERLQPRHLLDEVVSFFRRGKAGESSGQGMMDSIGEAGSRVTEFVKDHPVPLILVGAGVGWLIYQQTRGPSEEEEFHGAYAGGDLGESAEEERWRSRGEGTTAAGYYAPGEPTAQESAQGMTSGAKEAMRGAAESVRSAASRAQERASEMGQAVRERAAQAGARLQETAGAVGEQFQEGYEYSRQAVGETVDEYPLTSCIAAMSLGMLLGMVLPRTRLEDHYLGRTAEQFKTRAKETSRELYERGKRVASAAVEASTEEARREGLTPQALGEKVQNVANEAKETAKEEARRQREEMSGQQP